MTTQAPSSVGERIRQARENAGFSTASAFADAIGVRPGTVWRYESDRIKPSIGALSSIAAKCGVSMEWLVRGDEHSESSGAKPLPEADATGTEG